MTVLDSYKGCPPLAWMISERVTDPMIKLDCLIMITGKKGKGKSIFSLNLAYEISRYLSEKLGKTPSYFFNIDHIKSVDASGTFEMFSGDIIKKENSILIADDISIAANSRNSMTTQNKQLSQIMTVSRIYRNTIIFNTVYTGLVDKTARQFSDIVIEIIGIHKPSKQTICKAYLFEVNQQTGKEYRKFFTWKGKRIKYWLSGLPPEDLIKSYDAIRTAKTSELIHLFKDMHDTKTTGITKRDKKRSSIIEDNSERIKDMFKAGTSIREIARKTKLTEYWVNQCMNSED